MPFVDVFGHVLCDNVGVFVQRVEIARAHFGGNFVGYVQELAEVEIISLARLVVPEGRSKGVGVPLVNGIGSLAMSISMTVAFGQQSSSIREIALA